MIAQTLFHHAPLMPDRFAPLPLSALRPEGWLLEQLQTAREGLSGHLDQAVPESGDQSAWFGGALAGNAAPAALRALVSLAFLLGDKELISTVNQRVSYVLSHQREDGSFGPESADFASRGEMLVALWQYYTATAQRGVVLFLMRYFRYLAETLDAQPLDGEQALHTADTLSVGLSLYDLTGKSALLDVCRKLVAQGADWTGYFHTFNHRLPMSRHTPPHQMREGLERAGEESGYFERLQRMTTSAHVAHGLRVSTLSYALTGSSKHESAFDVGFSRIMKHHGTANGCFTGDPLLNGAHPSQGTDARSVVELMDSLAAVLAGQGSADAADALDRLAYNALGALFTADMHACQQLEQTNQIRITREKRSFYAEDDAATLFGASHDPHTLCALQRAWPVFASMQWMLSRDGGLAAIGFAPCVVRYRLGDTAVRVRTQSAYPFDGAVRITLSLSQPCAFPLHIRIPAWAQGATLAVDSDVIDAQPGTFAVINRQWRDGDEILLNLPMSVRLTRWYHESVAVERGPLVFALKLREDWEAHSTAGAYSPDWCVTTPESWNVALCEDALFDVSALPQEAAPFGHGCPVFIETQGYMLPDWGLRGASADQPPIAAEHVGREVRIHLEPYGACSLRIAQFPLVRP